MQLSNIALALTSVLGSKRKPALDLDFTRSEVLDPRITFSRTSNATRINAQGLIEYAPHNLLTNSEQFDNAVWVKTSAAVTANAIAAPDGTVTADLLTCSATATNLTQTYNVTIDPNDKYTAAIWLKGAASDIGKDVWVGLRRAGAGTLEQIQVKHTLTDSWVRVNVSLTFAYSQTGVIVDIRTNVSGGTPASAFYLWGAQLNIGSLQPYYATSVKNLLGYSQDFSDAAWTKSNSSIDATPVVGPFGYLGAMKLVENTVAGEHNLSEAITYTAGTPYTLSVYAKAGERNFVVLSYGSGAFGAATRAYFNLATGVVGTTVNSPTTSIVSIGGGWYRCSITKTATVSAAANTIINETSTNGVLSYTGDGSSGIYIFGAQLSDSASLDPYSYNTGAAPTSSAYYGPRFDYDPVTLAPKGLLIEEQRINILLNSDTLSTQSVSVTAQAYTLSFYGTGSIALSGAYTGSLVGTGAYPNQVQLTFTPTIGTLTLTVTGSVRYANLEAGAFPTSYIPTTSAQVTRTADNASIIGTNFSSWYNQSEGTFAVKYLSALSSGFVLSIMRTAGYGPGMQLSLNGANTSYLAVVDDASAVVCSVTSPGTKSAFAYMSNNFALSANGNAPSVDASGTQPTSIVQLKIGQSPIGDILINGHIQSIKYYPTRLPNGDLIALSS